MDLMTINLMWDNHRVHVTFALTLNPSSKLGEGL